MAEFKLNIGDPKSKKTLKKEVKDDDAEIFRGKQIGDKISGEGIGMPGYEFEITGGSDSTGVPMRRDVQGIARKRVLIVSGIGIRKNRAGRKVRRTVAGNTVSAKTAQINLKVVKHGKTPLFEEEKPEQEAAPEDSAQNAEKPAAEAKPAEAKPEEKSAEQNADSPKADVTPKEEAKPADGEQKAKGGDAPAEEKKE